MKKLMKQSLRVAKLCIAVIAIFMASVKIANAYDAANLQIEISGAQKSQFYVCVSSVGCVRIDSNKQTMPIDPLNVRYIFLAKTSNDQMYPQNLPSSCNVTVNSNQKLVVKGNLAKAANDSVYIANLHCAVVS
jgi:hypothetical protein